MNTDEMALFESSVALCMSYTEAVEDLQKLNSTISRRYYSDREYLDRYINDNKKKTLVVANFMPLILLFLLCCFIDSIDMDVFFVCIPISIVAGLILRIVINMLYRRKCAEQSLQTYKTEREHALNAQKKLIEIKPQLEFDVDSLRNTLDIEEFCCIPETYWNVADVLWSYIINKRASSLESAINLYHEEAHRRYIENEIENMQHMMKHEINQAKRIAQNAEYEAQKARNDARSANIASLIAIAISCDD